MADKQTPPNTDSLTGIDPSRSGSPYQGAGVYISSLSRDGDSLFAGHISEFCPTEGTYFVSIHNLVTNLPCLAVNTKAAALFGVREMGGLSIGTSVLVYVCSNQPMGYILGTLPPIDPESKKRPAASVSPNCGVNLYSIKDAWNPADWGTAAGCMPAGSGAAIDVLPGEHGYSNEFGLYMGLMRMVAILKGSDLAKVEAFAIDNLLRITGHNYEVLTATGEKRDSGYFGRVWREDFLAYTESESLGLATPGAFGEQASVDIRNTPEHTSSRKLKNPRQTGLFRRRHYQGWCADIDQEFIIRPNKKDQPTTPDAEFPPDAGMLHAFKSRFGRHFIRSLAGGGMHKVDRIAVPVKRRFPGEPGSDEAVKSTPVKDFDLVGGAAGPMGAGLKLGDYFAYLFGKQAPARFNELKKDFYIPDEPAVELLAGESRVPGIGKFFREFPAAKNVASGGQCIDDPIGEETKVVPGRAWVDILPDGSISWRDIWGCGIESRGGKIIITASHGIDFVTGGTIVATAGDDMVIRARNSVDVSATEKQVRFQGSQGVFVHSEKGGLQFSSASQGEKALNQKGEAYKIPGIVFKSATGVTVESRDIDIHASGTIKVVGSADGTLPSIVMKTSNLIFDMSEAASPAVFFSGEDNSVSFHAGMVLASKGIYSEGDAFFNGSGNFNSTITHHGGVLENPTPKKGKYSEQYTKLAKNMVDMSKQVGFKDEDLAQVKFQYRTVDDYSTREGKWFESDWQRELPGLAAWTEAKVNDSYPYPGDIHYTGGQNFFVYKPANVTEQGATKARQSLTEKGGTITGKSLNAFTVLPR